MLIKMHLPVFAMFGMLSITVPGSLAGLLVNRQADPMLTPSSTSSTGASQGTSSPSLPAPESPNSSKDKIYSIPLDIREDHEWGYPTVLVTMDELMTSPIKLAVSFHSNETWLRTSSEKVCNQPKRDQCHIPLDENPKKWAYIGQNDLRASGNKYTFSSFAPFDTKQGTNWKLDNFGVGVAWIEEDAIGLGNADGVLGLGPGSTFLQALTGSSIQAVSMYLGKDRGTLVIKGYHPKQASGGFVKQSIGKPGVLELQVENLSIKGDQTNLLKGIKAIIDPGSPDIIIPKSVQEALTKNKNTKWTIEEGELTFGSEGPKEGDRATFILDLGKEINVEIAEDAYTLPGKPAFRAGADNQLILGRPFLHSAYIIVDNTRTTFHVAQADTKRIDTDTPKSIADFEDKESEGTESPNDDDSDTELDPNEDSNSDSDSAEPSNTKTESNNNDSPESEDDESDTGINIAAIIGGIVGGLVLVAVIFGVFLWRRRRSLRQVHEIQGYMGTPKRLSEGSDFDIAAVSGTRSLSPQQILQEDTYLMEGYHPVQFREEMNFSGPAPLPPSMQYHYEEDDQLCGFQGSTSSSRPLRRDQDLMRADSIISTTDVHVPTTTDRSATHVPRLPMFHSSRPDSAAL